MTRWMSVSCEFGACGFQQGGQSQDPWAKGIDIAIPSEIWVWAHRQTTPVRGNWQYGNWCGAGGAGRPENKSDALCMVHDYCFDMTGADASAMTDPAVWAKLSPSKRAAVRNCNQTLWDSIRAAPISPLNPNPRRRVANIEIPWFFTTRVPKGAGCRP